MRIWQKIAFSVSLLGINFIAIRGTFEMYPLGKMVPTLSENRFINSLSQNGAKYFIEALKLRLKFKNGNYDLISKLGYNFNDLNINKILNETEYITPSNPTLEKIKPNVVFIMVESFGYLPLEYNNENFNIMGELKAHFNSDFLWTNFIASGNGTIESLESLMLNIQLRPESMPFVESRDAHQNFSFAPSEIYNRAGYFSRFIYGGDLSWRNIGDFAKVQGFASVEGKAHILKTAQNYFGNRDFLHPWGIHDEYLYHHIYRILNESKNPQFIFALTTDNHPPYKLPREWISPSLNFSDRFSQNISGNLDLAKARFLSFQYALHSLGKFITKIKKSPLNKNTIIVVTADHNIPNGILKYSSNHDDVLNYKRIPLYIYIPKDILNSLEYHNIDTNLYGSHKDIFPTIYDLSLSNTKYNSIGISLLRKDLSHFGANISGIVISKDKILTEVNLQKSQIVEENLYKDSLLKTELLIRNEREK
jgi:phosphoglycerol transferase MdoB-like AlkP superfamily enzyme